MTSTKIEPENVESTNIKAIWWNKGTAYIVFKVNPNNVYLYDGVTESEFRRFMASESMGKYLNKNWKDKYAFEKKTAAEIDLNEVYKMVNYSNEK